MDSKSNKYTEEAFNKEFTSFRIKDVNLKVKKGQLIIIIGKIGSGKSSILYSLLGEMTETKKAQKALHNQNQENTLISGSTNPNNTLRSTLIVDKNDPSLKIDGS